MWQKAMPQKMVLWHSSFLIPLAKHLLSSIIRQDPEAPCIMSSSQKNFKPKPYRCSECGRRFSRPNALTQHTNRVHTVPLALRRLQAEEDAEANQVARGTPSFTNSPPPLSFNTPPLQSPIATPRTPNSQRRSQTPRSQAPSQRSRQSPRSPIFSPRRTAARDQTFKPATRIEYHPLLDGMFLCA